MASALKDALPARLKPSNGEAEGRHHGKSQSHVVSFPLIHSVVLSSRERRRRRRAAEPTTAKMKTAAAPASARRPHRRWQEWPSAHPRTSLPRRPGVARRRSRRACPQGSNTAHTSGKPQASLKRCSIRDRMVTCQYGCRRCNVLAADQSKLHFSSGTTATNTTFPIYAFTKLHIHQPTRVDTRHLTT